MNRSYRNNFNIIIRLLLVFILLTTITHAQWVQTNGPFGGSIKAIGCNGTKIYAGTAGKGLYLSNDNGSSWNSVFGGTILMYVEKLLVSDTNNLFIGTSIGIYHSINNGPWTSANIGITNTSIKSLIKTNTDLFASTGGVGGIYHSANNGTSWTAINTGLTNLVVTALAANGNDLFAGTSGGIFHSTNNGISWSQVNNGLSNLNIHTIVINGSNIFAGTSGGGVFYSGNNGNSWIPVNNGLQYNQISVLLFVGNTLYAGTTGAGIFMTSNNGGSWSSVNNGLTNHSIGSIAANGSTLFAGTVGVPSSGGIYRSFNNGNSWVPSNNGLTYATVNSIKIIGTNIFAATYSGVFRSSNNGNSWVPVNNGLIDPYISTLTSNGTTLFVGTNNAVFQSTNNGNLWTSIGAFSSSVTAIAFKGSDIYVGTQAGDIFYTSNNGVLWTDISIGLPGNPIQTLQTNGGLLFAGTANYGVYISTNNGSSWSASNNGLTTLNIASMIISDTNIFVGTNPGNIFHSTDNANSWNLIANMPSGPITDILLNDNILIAGNTTWGVRLIANINSTWMIFDTGLSNSIVYSLANDSNFCFAGTLEEGIFINSTLLCTSVNSITVSACDSYISPSGIHTWNTSGIYIDTLMNSDGCDSLLLIDLTIIPIPVVTITASGSTTFCKGDNVVLSSTQGLLNYQWYRRNYAIPGATLFSYIAENSGRYKCIAQNVTQCSDTSNIIVVNVPCMPLGPNQQREITMTEWELENFLISPNPGTGLFSIKSPPGQLQVFNSIGQLILSLEITDEISNFDMSDYIDGIYFVTLKTGELLKSQKIILSR